MATASTIDAMAKAVMASFGQEESKAVAWAAGARGVARHTAERAGDCIAEGS